MEMASSKILWRQEMVKELQTVLHEPCLFVTQFSKLPVKEVEALRRELKPLESRYLVAKNTLSRLALRELKLESVSQWVNGQTGFVVGRKDPVTLSKILVKFIKDHETLKLRGGFLEGEMVTEADIRFLAALPSREVLLGKAVFMIQSPINRLHGVLVGNLRKLMFVLQELSKKREGTTP